MKNIDVSVTTILDIMKKYGTPNISLINRAYNTAIRYHKGQLRKSGCEYITHPVAVACILADMGMESDIVASGLLHDVLEDTEYALEDMRKEFGDLITQIVDAVTKVEKDKNATYQKILEGLKFDPRVAYVKLADRIHNMETLEYLPSDKKKRMLDETVNVYIPLSIYLGAYLIQRKLENYWFSGSNFEKYNATKKIYNDYIDNKKGEVLKIYYDLKYYFYKFCNAEVILRERDIYNFFKKREKYRLNSEKAVETHELYFIFKDADDESDIVDKCFEILEENFENIRDVKNCHRDYIRNPRNGYRSFHMTLKDTQSFVYFRAFIRTETMHREAERGRLENVTNFLNLPVNIESNMNLEETYDAIQTGFTESKIYIYTEKNDTFIMKKDSTVLDFAFEIHTEIGYHAKCAIVNGGKELGIYDKLEFGMVVKVIVDEKIKPEFNWIKHVTTPNAKRKLVEYFQSEYGNC